MFEVQNYRHYSSLSVLVSRPTFNHGEIIMSQLYGENLQSPNNDIMDMHYNVVSDKCNEMS